MSIIVSCIAIGLIQTAWSDSQPSSTKVCVTGAAMDHVNVGLQGEYTYGGKDGEGHEYWEMPKGTDCNLVSDTSYVRYSTAYNIWEIAYENKDWCYYYGCNIDTTLPSECGHDQWSGSSGIKEDFYVLAGECPAHQTETYLTVSNYGGRYQGCNGKFIAVNGKKDLYVNEADYDYGDNPAGPYGVYTHYWLYSITYQEWYCHKDREHDLEQDPSMADYANGCYTWGEQDHTNTIMNFHN